MLAAEIWHWWIGLILALTAAVVLGVLVAGYLRTVVQPQYPDKRHRSDTTT
jgi:hypothetical protein